MSNSLQFSITLLAPLMAVYATDIAVRRNRYDGLALHGPSDGPASSRRAPAADVAGS